MHFHLKTVNFVFVLNFSTDCTPPTDSIWICEYCGNAYKQKISLTNHIQSAHSDERAYQCDVCSGRYVWGIQLIQHSTRLSVWSILTCFSLCRSFKTSRALKEHQRITHTKRRFNCKRCNETFKYKSKLYLHSKRHDGPLPKPHTCDLCGKAFTEKRAVKVCISKLWAIWKLYVRYNSFIYTDTSTHPHWRTTVLMWALRIEF